MNRPVGVLRLAGATVLLAFLCGAKAPSASNTPARRPAETKILADFEDPASVAPWKGLPCERTDERASSGRYALRFTVPAWAEGREPRPGIRLPLDFGNGSADFSQYGKIIVDAWVEGEQPGQLGLKLRDTAGNDSWTTHITVHPHQWNRAELLIREAAADSDVRLVKEVVLYALRPTNTFTLVVDHLRLEPAEPPALAQFLLRHPNYRGWILPGEREAEVEIAVAPYEHGYQPRDLRLRLEISTGSYHRTVERRWSEDTNRLAIAVEGAAPGDAMLKATIHSRNRELASRTWPLRILTTSEVAGLKVYVDRANRLIVDGRPFFPLGWYGSVDEAQLAEIADSPFNCLLAYGTDLVPPEQMRRFLDRMQVAGLRLVYCLNDVYPTATYLEGKAWEGIRGNDAIAAAVVAAYRDHPAVLAWYLNDELPHALAPRLEDYYHRVQSGDPAHPCFIVLCNRSELTYFPQTTDILGVDPYPIPREPVTRVADFVTVARQAVRDNQPVWLVPQAFAWYQYNSRNPDRGHLPADEELRAGRAPTYEEERCMTYLGLIHGAKGLIYYCYYDLRVLPQYRQMWGWMKSIAAEVKTLTPALMSTESAGAWSLTPKESPVQASLFRQGNRLYLLAANPAQTARRVDFDLRRRTGTEVEVLFENRQLAAGQGRFADEFLPLAVHVYAIKLNRASGL
jgi:hypothetical protein